MAKVTKGTMDVRLRGVHTPTNDTDAANKEYVDGQIAAIGSINLADGSVTTAKLADDAVTSAKLGPNSVDATALNVADDGSNGQVLTSDGDGSFSWRTNTGLRHAIERDGTAFTDRAALNFSTIFSVVDDATNNETVISIGNDAISASQLNVSGNGSAGQVLSSDGDGSFTWVTDSGGSIPEEHVTLSLSPSDVEAGANANIDLTGTITLSGGHTFLGTGDADNGAGGNDTLVAKIRRGGADTTLPAAQVTHTLTSNTFTVRLTPSDRNSAGELRVEAVVKARSQDGSVTTRTVTGTANIQYGWRHLQSATPPSDINTMTDNGIWNGTGTQTFTSTADGGRKAYIALPTRSTGYTFKSGILFVTATSRGVISTNFTLYEIEDANDGFAGTLTVEITET